MVSTQNITQRYAYWATHPFEWVKDIFGENIRLTTQQMEGMEALRKLCKAKLKLANNQELDDDDKRYINKIGISIFSGHGTGKDFFASLVSFFFLYVFPYPKILCTAPTSYQLQSILWSEIAKVAGLSKKVNGDKTILESLFTIQNEKVYLTSLKGQRWFATARTINTKAQPEAQGETLAGTHEDYMLYIVDEASGVPDPVFKPIEGSLTGKLNIAILLANPTRTKGFMYNTQYGGDNRFINLRWNAEESEIVSKQSIQLLAEKYGVDSTPYRIRVLGLPPKTDRDSFIPYEWIQDAIDRDITPPNSACVVKGFDPGGGNDPSVIATRIGGVVKEFQYNTQRDTNMVASWVINNFDEDEADILFMDGVGLGSAIFYILQRDRRGRIINVDARAKVEDRFLNMRAKMYWNLRCAFENKTISIPNNQNLIDQLSMLKLEVNSCRIQIINKRKIRRELSGSSSNEADALALTYAYPEMIYHREKTIINRIRQPYYSFMDDRSSYKIPQMPRETLQTLMN